MSHEVTNQPPPLVGHDAADDPVLLAGLEREGAGWVADEVHRLGRLAGSAEAQQWADQANRVEPVLHTHDRYGHRIDEVEFHPAYHRLMEVAVGAGLAAAPWADVRTGVHVARAAGFMVWSGLEAAHGCPVSMTYSVVPALRNQPDLAAAYEPLLTSRSYDPVLRAPLTKPGILAGMGMTEKQGGTDVRANTTRAVPAGDGTWRLTGHKWFTSAPMNDVFLVLAQAPAGLSCFLVPRILPDGSRNAFAIQRLKDKLGNRANASSEPEFTDTVGWLVGGAGDGVRTILGMVAATRLDCVLGSASGMRAALAQADHHVRHRSVFGALLVDQPLMRNVVADLSLESEAATTLALRLAGAVDRGERDFARLAVTVGKYWVCKRQPSFVAEALECLGGNGYVEESGMPRLYRDAPLNGIWEGSGNVQALDVLRVLGREPAAVAAVSDEISAALGADRRLDAAWSGLQARLHRVAGSEPEVAQLEARALTESLALVLQAALLVRHAPAAVADAFCASRLEGAHSSYGTLPAGVDVAALLDRAPVGLRA